MTGIRFFAAPDAQHEVTPSGARQAFVLLVAVRPAIGAYVVAAWLVGIIVSLVSIGGYYRPARPALRPASPVGRDQGRLTWTGQDGRCSGCSPRPS